jgi:hypothetical protein
MKKAVFGIAGVGLLALMLATVGGVALASGEEPATFAVPEVRVSSGVDILPAGPDAVVSQPQDKIPVEDVSDVVLSDDDPGDEAPEDEHGEGDCVEGGWVATQTLSSSRPR